jgi:hypothetical protein
MEPEFTTCLKGTLSADSPQGSAVDAALAPPLGRGRTRAANRRLRQAAQVFTARLSREARGASAARLIFQRRLFSS